MTKALLVALANPVESSRETEFLEWYDDVHVPEVMQAGEIVRATRYRLSDSQVMHMAELPPSCLVIYEIESDNIADFARTVASRASDPGFKMSSALQVDPPPFSVIYELVKGI